MQEDLFQSLPELRLDPASLDIVLRRRPTNERDLNGNPVMMLETNVPWSAVWHSPTGYEWGYCGSGPADLALNILSIFIPPHVHDATCYEKGEDPTLELICTGNERCYKGEVHPLVARLHQRFKEEFIAQLPRKGAVIRGTTICGWVCDRIDKMDPAELEFMPKYQLRLSTGSVWEKLTEASTEEMPPVGTCEYSNYMLDRLFDDTWEQLATQGACDTLGGAEYRMLKDLWRQSGRCSLPAHFIRREANRAPADGTTSPAEG